MKTAIFLFFLLMMFASLKSNAGLPPTTAAGQNQSPTTTFNFQTPNNLATKVQGGTLLESGNTNILVNPSFEHQAGDTGWTVGGTATAGSEASVVVHGKKSYSFTASSQTVDLSQSSTLYQAQFADGVQGLSSIRVKTNHTGTCSVCSVQAGTVSTANCVSVQANNKWGLYKVPMILGATSNGISLACTSGTGLTYVDDAFVGAVDLKADVDQSRIAGYAYFNPTANCTWSRTSTTLGAFGTDADCPGPTIGYSSMGSWQTTDTDLPRVTVNNLPAGTYKATFIIPGLPSTGTSNSFSMFDGSSTCQSTNGPGATSDPTNTVLSCVFTYTSSGNRSFEIYGHSSSGSLFITNTTATAFNPTTKFFLEYFGSGSVYTSTNADTDWASCGHTPSDFTGFGTVTSIETQCKREGSDLLMRGKFTSGVSTGVEARVNLKLGGAALTSASSSVIPTIQLAGFGFRNVASATTDKMYSITIQPSVAHITFALGPYATAQNPLLAQNGDAIIANGVTMSINARIPISGWTNSNLIIGQFNGLESCANTLECTDTFSAKVSSAGVVSDENVNFLNGNCSLASSTFTCPFNSSIFTVAPNCTIGPAQNGVATVTRIDSTSSSQIVVSTFASTSGAPSAGAFNLICQKQGADYIGKTAKAVASDQNVRSIGAVGVDIQSISYGGNSTCSSVCSASPCTTCNPVGSKVTSMTRIGLGQYNLNGVDGTKYNCQVNGYGGTTYTAPFHDRGASSSSLARITSANATTVVDSYGTITCIGIP